MTQIKITRPIGPHTIGDTINATPGAANYLINAGYAEATTKKATGKATASKTDGKQVGGDSHPEPRITAG